MSSTEEAPGQGLRTRSLVVAAAVVAVVLAVLVAVLVRPSPEKGATTATPRATTSAPAAAGQTQAARTGSACALPDENQVVPRTTPQGTEWELVGRVAAPTAPEVHGPAVAGPVRSCFARTPLGALYSAANVLASTTLPDAGRVLAQDLAAEGPGRDIALGSLPPSEPTPADAGAPFQLAGFSFLSYTQDETVIDLAVLGVSEQQGVLGHTPMTLRWEDDDWRLVYAPDGSPFPRVQGLTSLAGYVPWSGT